MPRFPADLVIVDPTVRLSLRSTQALPSLGVGYFTGGADWQASYQVILAGANARVTGTAVVQSSTLSVSEADLQLLAGDVGGGQNDQVAYKRNGRWPPSRWRPARPPNSASARRTSTRCPARSRCARADVDAGALRAGLRPGGEAARGPVRAPLLGRPRAVGRRAGRSGGGDLRRDPRAQDAVRRHARARAACARIYQKDDAGRLQLIGESGLDHTAAGQPLELNAGTAFDLTAKRTQTTYTSARDKNGRVTATADYSVSLANATDSAATVDVYEERGGDWSVLQSSIPGDRVSSTRVRFRVAVPAKGDATLTYRIKATW